MNKKFKFFVLTLAFLLILPSCAKKDYREDVDCSELAREASAVAADAGEYEEYGTDFLKYNFENTEIPADYAVSYTVETNNINEIGVFRAPDKDGTKEVKEIIGRYLETLRDEKTAFIASYAPEEVPKLTDAEVRVYGNYVVYLILDKEDREKAFEKIESMLSK